MDSDAAQLASVATTLEELTARVVEAADRLRDAHRDDQAADLYEVERALRTASRRLAVVQRRLGGSGRGSRPTGGR